MIWATAEQYFSRQLITYLGNKRALIPVLREQITAVSQRLGGKPLTALDLFSGSGLVSRILQPYCVWLGANDLESYARVISECYLRPPSIEEWQLLSETVHSLNREASSGAYLPGFIQDLYAPADEENILPQDRVFYSRDNARRLDFFRQKIAELPDSLQPQLLAPLLAAASIHVNTAGVFKGFYKDRKTKIGRFGGSGENALARILKPIELQLPFHLKPEYHLETAVFQRDANSLLRQWPQLSKARGFPEKLDLIYLDPPYNQHPYGSNYFMLNLLVHYQPPTEISAVSGIPKDWNRSGYNVKRQAAELLAEVIALAPADFILLSFNAEGYISIGQIREILNDYGRLQEAAVDYPVYRGSRNLRDRSLQVKEHLFLLEKG